MRVVLVDDSTLFREGLAGLLKVIGVNVVGTAINAEDGLASVAEHHPDVVITDIRMPPTFTDEGLLAARRLKDLYPAMGVLVLSAHVMAASAARLLDGQSSGVGYLLKDRVDDVETLRDGIVRVSRGELVIDPGVIQALLRRRNNFEVLEKITGREQQLLGLMAEGRSNAAVAAQMHLAVKTVEKSVASIFTKLGLTESSDDNRRVLAVLAWLQAHHL